MLSKRYIFEDDAPNVVMAALAAVNAVEAAGGDSSAAPAYASLGYVARMLRLRRVAEQYFERAAHSAQCARDLDGHAEARVNEAAAALGAADWQRAEPVVQDALALAQRAHNPQQEEVARTIGFYVDYFRGRYEAALEWLPQLSASAKARGNRQHLGWALVMRGTLLQERGELDEARALVDRARELLAEARDHVTETLCLGVLAGIEARRGEAEHALALAGEARRRIAARFPVVFSIARGLEGAALAPLHLWEAAHSRGEAVPAELRRAAVASCRHYVRYGRIFPVGAPGAHWCAARLERLQGRPLHARAHVHRCLWLASRLGMPYAWACAQTELVAQAAAPAEPPPCVPRS